MSRLASDTARNGGASFAPRCGWSATMTCCLSSMRIPCSIRWRAYENPSSCCAASSQERGRIEAGRGCCPDHADGSEAAGRKQPEGGGSSDMHSFKTVLYALTLALGTASVESPAMADETIKLAVVTHG